MCFRATMGGTRSIACQTGPSHSPIRNAEISLFCHEHALSWGEAVEERGPIIVLALLDRELGNG